MSERRTIVLLNTSTMIESEVVVELHDLSREDRANIPKEDWDSATVNAAAEEARDKLDAETGKSHLVLDVRRG